MDKENSKRILLFLGIVFIITYLIDFIFIVPLAHSTDISDGLTATFLSAAVMMIPAISVFLTRIITREGFTDHYLLFSLKNGNMKYYLLAWFLPAVLIALGALLYFAVFPYQFDWNMSYYLGNVTKSGTIVTVEALRKTMISQLITGVILGPIMNCITCFGEEWGWRGYLLPKLMKTMPMYAAIVLDGILWGLWYLPLIIAGKNYGFDYDYYPYAGIAMMILFCTVLGVFFSYLTIKTKSCVPSIIGQGALNSVASVGIVFTCDGGKMLLGPSITGLISLVPAIITAVIVLHLLRNDNACATDSSCDTINEV